MADQHQMVLHAGENNNHSSLKPSVHRSASPQWVKEAAYAIPQLSLHIVPKLEKQADICTRDHDKPFVPHTLIKVTRDTEEIAVFPFNFFLFLKSLYAPTNYVSWWVSVSGFDCGLCSQREEMPMCAFIPITALSLSPSPHVKRTGIWTWARYHWTLIKDSHFVWNKILGNTQAKCTLQIPSVISL